MTIHALTTDIDLRRHMMEFYDEQDDWAALGQSLESTRKVSDEELVAMMEGNTDYWNEKPKISVSHASTPVRKPVNLPTASKAAREFAGAIEKRHTPSYLMRNVASADKEKSTGVTLISEQERSKYIGATPEEFRYNFAKIISETDEFKNSNRKQKALKRREEVQKRSIFRPNALETHFPLLGEKKRLTPNQENKKMNTTNEQTKQEEVVGQSQPAPLSTEKKLEKLSIHHCSTESIESESTVNSEGLVDLPEPTLPQHPEVENILRRQFESIGYEFHGSATLKRKNGIYYSVSFTERDKKPDFDNYDTVLSHLANLAFEDYLIYGLREFMTIIPKIEAPLHRWQVCLEKISEDKGRREEQCVFQLVNEAPMEIANSYYRPPEEQTIDIPSEEIQKTEEPPLVEETIPVVESAREESDDEVKAGGKTRIARLKALCRENPDAIIESSKGKITVSQWVQDLKERRKLNKKLKKNPPIENAREEAGAASVSEPETSVKTFSDDSIPKEAGKTLKEKTAHLLKVKKNPEKVVGQRKWSVGKGMKTTETFNRTLANGLTESKQVFTWSPDPVVAVPIRKPRYAKCPIEGFPVGVWRRYDTNGKTEDEVKEIAKRAFGLFVRSEVAYLRNRWSLSRQRGFNPWLASARNITIAFCENPIADWWLAYQVWHEKAVAFVSANASEEQKMWGVKQKQTNYESN